MYTSLGPSWSWTRSCCRSRNTSRYRKKVKNELLDACDDEDVEFLLRFDDPLEVVRGYWESEISGYDHSEDRMVISPGIPQGSSHILLTGFFHQTNDHVLFRRQKRNGFPPLAAVISILNAQLSPKCQGNRIILGVQIIAIV